MGENPFLSHPSLRDVAIIRDMQGLRDVNGLEYVERVIAIVTAPARHHAFAQRYHVTQRRGHICVERLQGKRSCTKRTCSSLFPPIPGGDHVSEWMRNGQTVCIVSQPYGVSAELFVETAQYCDAHDLDVSIDATLAWHFPGKSLLLIYTRKGFSL